jgi:ERCC4-related helicase
LKDIKADLKNLDDILKQASTIDCKRDAKLEQLKKCIEEKIEKPINPKNKKALIFTAFSDTSKISLR